MNYEYTRRPFLILSYENKDIAVPKQLMMDFSTGKMYVRSIDGTKDIEIGKTTILNIIAEEIDKMMDGVPEDGNTFKKLRELIYQIEKWKNIIYESGSDNVDTLGEILDKFRDMGESNPTLVDQLNSKVDKVIGKVLSTNDLTNELFQKLINIEENANKYIHPSTKQCNYTAPVLSVNGRVEDNIVITKEELGLGNVEAGANRYAHPTSKQCSITGISSLNSKTGDVKFSKSDINLGNVMNYSMATQQEALDNVDDKYLSPLRAKQILDLFIQNNKLRKLSDRKYDVVFVDWDNTVLKTVTVPYGGSTTPPPNPSRKGYKFNGWSGVYTNVTSDVTIYAMYSVATVYDYNYSILSPNTVVSLNEYGGEHLHISAVRESIADIDLIKINDMAISETISMSSGYNILDIYTTKNDEFLIATVELNSEYGKTYRIKVYDACTGNHLTEHDDATYVGRIEDLYIASFNKINIVVDGGIGRKVLYSINVPYLGKGETKINKELEINYNGNEVFGLFALFSEDKVIAHISTNQNELRLYNKDGSYIILSNLGNSSKNIMKIGMLQNSKTLFVVFEDGKVIFYNLLKANLSSNISISEYKTYTITLPIEFRTSSVYNVQDISYYSSVNTANILFQKSNISPILYKVIFENDGISGNISNITKVKTFNTQCKDVFGSAAHDQMSSVFIINSDGKIIKETY